MPKTVKLWRIGIWYKGTLDTMWAESFIVRVEIKTLEDVRRLFKSEYESALVDNVPIGLLIFIKQLYHNLVYDHTLYHIAWKPVFVELDI